MSAFELMAVIVITAVSGKNFTVVIVVWDFPELDRPLMANDTGSFNNRLVRARYTSFAQRTSPTTPHTCTDCSNCARILGSCASAGGVCNCAAVPEGV